jgi:hypothetical protein
MIAPGNYSLLKRVYHSIEARLDVKNGFFQPIRGAADRSLTVLLQGQELS